MTSPSEQLAALESRVPRHRLTAAHEQVRKTTGRKFLSAPERLSVAAVLAGDETSVPIRGTAAVTAAEVARAHGFTAPAATAPAPVAAPKTFEDMQRALRAERRQPWQKIQPAN